MNTNAFRNPYQIRESNNAEQNWKVTWHGPGRTEVRYFDNRTTAEMFAEHMNARSYRNRATVSFVGMTDHARATFAAGAL